MDCPMGCNGLPIMGVQRVAPINSLEGASTKQMISASRRVDLAACRTYTRRDMRFDGVDGSTLRSEDVRSCRWSGSDDDASDACR